MIMAMASWTAWTGLDFTAGLVMQDRGVLVVRDDVVIGHLLLALRAGLEVTHVGEVLGGALAKRGESRTVPAGAEIVGEAHALELVRRLDRAVEMQSRQ